MRRPSDSSSSRACPAGSSGTPSIRAKSLPRPAGTMPSVPPRSETSPASEETIPSPPTDTTTSPRSIAPPTRSTIACGPGEYVTSTSAPASRSNRATGTTASGAAPPPEDGLTRKVKALPFFGAFFGAFCWSLTGSGPPG